MQPTVTVPVASPAVFYIPADAITRKYDRYNAKASIILGILQIIVGVICLILNSVSIGISRGYSIGIIGHGIWCGIMFIVTGSIGCSASKTKSKCQVVSYMVLCIIAACFAAVLLALGIYIAIMVASYMYYYYGPYAYDLQGQEIALQACMAIGGFIEGLLCIFGAVICCRAGVCCCPTPETSFVLASYSPNSGVVLLQQPGAQGLQSPQPGITTAPNSQQVPMVNVHPTGFSQYGMAQAGATTPSAYYFTGNTPVLLNEENPQKDDVKQSIHPPPYSRLQ